MASPPPEPPYWHGHSWQPTGVTWDEGSGKFSDGSPATGPGGGPWTGPVIGPPNPPGYNDGSEGYGEDDEVPDPEQQEQRSGLMGWFSRG